MKTPMLFDVPKDSPSKRDRLEAFKKEHKIFTHRSDGMHEPWSAMSIPKAVELLDGYDVTENDHPIEIIAGYCRLLDVTGDGELSAIRLLCSNCGIPCDL